MSENKFKEEIGDEQVGIVKEFILFLKDNKKWWLLPILICLLLLGALLFLGGSAAAPFIYTLF